MPIYSMENDSKINIFSDREYIYHQTVKPQSQC